MIGAVSGLKDDQHAEVMLCIPQLTATRELQNNTVTLCLSLITRVPVIHRRLLVLQVFIQT